MAHDYEDDRIEHTRADSALQGVCKDCGNGSMNNELYPAFEILSSDGVEDSEEWRCIQCGSTHLDLL